MVTMDETGEKILLGRNVHVQNYPMVPLNLCIFDLEKVSAKVLFCASRLC